MSLRSRDGKGKNGRVILKSCGCMHLQKHHSEELVCVCVCVCVCSCIPERTLNGSKLLTPQAVSS